MSIKEREKASITTGNPVLLIRERENVGISKNASEADGCCGGLSSPPGELLQL